MDGGMDGGRDGRRGGLRDGLRDRRREGPFSDQAVNKSDSAVASHQHVYHHSRRQGFTFCMG